MASANPYSASALFRRFLMHRISGKSVSNLHSPLFYGLCEHIFLKRTMIQGTERIEQRRKQLLGDTSMLRYKDPGASQKTVTRTVSQFCRRSHHVRLAQLKARVADYFRVNRCIELGAGTGLGAAWLKAAMPYGSSLITVEGVCDWAELARETSRSTGLSFDVRDGLFDDLLPELLEECGDVDMVILDGNHRLVPTLRYLEWILPYCHNETVLVFDDIHWSPEMEQAWTCVCEHPAIVQSLDLFGTGLAFPYRNAAREHIKVCP